MTNFDLAHLRIAVGSGIPIATNQVCLSLLDGRALGEMAEYCEEHGIKIIAYGCIAGGFLTDGVVGAAEPTEEALTYTNLLQMDGMRRAITEQCTTMSCSNFRPAGPETIKPFSPLNTIPPPGKSAPLVIRPMICIKSFS